MGSSFKRAGRRNRRREKARIGGRRKKRKSPAVAESSGDKKQSYVGGGNVGGGRPTEGDRQPAATSSGSTSRIRPVDQHCAQEANDVSLVSNLRVQSKEKPRGSKGVGSKKNRRRRGRRKNLHSTTSLKLLHLNPRGWVSKRAAILDVIDLVKPDYVNINKTQLRAGNKLNINGYTCFSKHRKNCECCPVSLLIVR